MPLIKSAIKKARQDLLRTARNRLAKNKIKSVLKKFLASKNPQDFKLVQSAIDRAVKNKVYKKNTASRIKSRLAKLVKKERVKKASPVAVKTKRAKG